MRKMLRSVVIVIVAIAALWLLKKLDVIPSFSKIFSSQPVAVDETPILVKEIKSIGQLITYSLSDEVVADSVILTKGAAFVNSFALSAPSREAIGLNRPREGSGRNRPFAFN